MTGSVISSVNSFLLETATADVLWKKVFFKILQNFKPEACNFIKNETLTRVFSCEFCEISKNTCFTEQLRATASLLCYEP